MAKQQTKKSVSRCKRLLLTTAIPIAVLIAILASVYTYQRFDRAASHYEMFTVRELIVQAVRGLKTDAPIDPKTGDIYFPALKLRVPATEYITNLTYSYDTYANELSISNPQVTNRNISRLYSAQSNTELFGNVPKLQSCQRGVTLSFAPRKADGENQLQYSKQLANGKTMYLYLEKGCPELKETAQTLQAINSY